MCRPRLRGLVSGVSVLALAALGACNRSDGPGGSSQEVVERVPGGGAVTERPARAEETLPELSHLRPFALRNQAEEPVSLESFRGKVWAAAFMFTRCPTVCPEITRRMKRVQDGAKERGVKLELVSFSVDPEHDTPEVLTKYAEEYGADLASWAFLTGDYETIARTAEEGFKVGLSGRPDPNAEHMGITHGSHLVLVDREGVIRGYYRTSEDAQLERLLVDAARLL